jgi:hypothetical protein
MPPPPRRGKRNPLVAIGAVVSLAGLSFYLYQQYLDSVPPADPRNDSNQSAGGPSQSSKKVRLCSVYYHTQIPDFIALSTLLLDCRSSSQVYRYLCH